jgi:glycyl-tRNA synthetase beta subunit
MASTVTKVVLIGCLAVVIGVIVVIAAGGFFVRSKFKEFTQGTGEHEKKTEQLSKDYPFTVPANGVITEAQLQRFLAARKQIYAVYKKYESEFKKLEGKDADLSVLTKGWSFWKEVRNEQANALAAQKMSPEEYQYIVNAVYKTWAASGTKEALKDQSFSDQAEKQLKESIESIDKQIQDPATNETVKKALQKTRDEMQKQLDSLPDNSMVKQMDETLDSVPEENLALFKKYEKDIRQYSMAGLEYAGL